MEPPAWSPCFGPCPSPRFNLTAGRILCTCEPHKASLFPKAPGPPKSHEAPQNLCGSLAPYDSLPPWLPCSHHPHPGHTPAPGPLHLPPAWMLFPWTTCGFPPHLPLHALPNSRLTCSSCLQSFCLCKQNIRGTGCEGVAGVSVRSRRCPTCYLEHGRCALDG